MNENKRRTPHGVRGLKSVERRYGRCVRPCRTPHGVRGLKYVPVSVWFREGVAPLTGCVD